MSERFYQPTEASKPFLPEHLANGWWQQLPAEVPEHAEVEVAFGPMRFAATMTTGRKIEWSEGQSHEGFVWTVEIL